MYLEVEFCVRILWDTCKPFGKVIVSLYTPSVNIWKFQLLSLFANIFSSLFNLVILLGV